LFEAMKGLEAMKRMGIPSRRVGATVGILALLAVVIGFTTIHVTTEGSGSPPSEVKVVTPAGVADAPVDGSEVGDVGETVSDARPLAEDPDSDGDGEGEQAIRDLDLDDPATAAVAHQEPTAAPTVAPTPVPSADRTAPRPSASADD
jgi:hypothetical protein